MRKFALIFQIFLCVALAAFLTACDSSTVEPTNEDISVTIEGAKTETVKSGTKVTRKVSIVAKKKLAEFRIIKDGGTFFVKDKDFTNPESFAYTFEYATTAADEGKTLNFGFEVTDKEGTKANSSLAITVEKGVTPPPTSELVEYNSIVLGAQNNTTLGSSLDAETGKIYLIKDATANAAAIDLIYFHGAAGGTNEASVCNPTDDAVTFVLPQVATWSPKNNTELRMTALTGTEFGMLTAKDGNMLVDYFNKGMTLSPATRATKLTFNKVIAFKTVGGKYGLFFIKGIGAGETGSVSGAVKIQK